MHEFCHRCGGELPSGSGESPFCPHCGSPQLFLSLDFQSVETGGDGDGQTAPGTPTPRPRQVDWKMAIRCAVVVAAVAGVLSLGAMRVSLLLPVSSIWVMSASLITLGLYQKRRPLAWMDAGTGARIGVLVGLCLAFGLAIPLAVAGVILRFGLHSMDGFDKQMVELMSTAITNSKTPVPIEVVQFFNAPEFRAGFMLVVSAAYSVFLLVLSTVGGAFAGMLQMRRKPAV